MNDYMRYQMMRQRMTSKENHDRREAGPWAPEYEYRGDMENRRRDGRGRFAEYNYGNATFDAQDEPTFEGTEFYGEPRSEYYGAYGNRYDGGARRVIGFTQATQHMNKGSGGSMERMGGMSDEDELPKMDMEMAEEWTKMMRNDDGSKGAHWNMEKTSAILKQRGYKHTQAEWYAVMNAMYSDFYGVAKKFGLAGNPEFFADLANAWLNDKDAVEEKASAYFCCVVKH